MVEQIKKDESLYAEFKASQAFEERREALGESPKASKLYGLSEWFREQKSGAEHYRVLVELLRLLNDGYLPLNAEAFAGIESGAIRPG